MCVRVCVCVCVDGRALCCSYVLTVLCCVCVCVCVAVALLDQRASKANEAGAPLVRPQQSPPAASSTSVAAAAAAAAHPNQPSSSSQPAAQQQQPAQPQPQQPPQLTQQQRLQYLNVIKEGSAKLSVYVKNQNARSAGRPPPTWVRTVSQLIDDSRDIVRVLHAVALSALSRSQPCVPVLVLAPSIGNSV